MDGLASFTDSEGMVWQIEQQRWEEAERMAAVITRRYPPADQHVVAMLSEIGGRGWQDSIRLIIQEQDVTAELRPLYDHLATRT